VVLTTRELARMIRSAGIDFDSLPDEEMDAPLGLSTGAADIFANTGGVMEAALRTAYEIVTGKELPTGNLHVAAVAGLTGVKEASLEIRGTTPEWKFLEGVTVRVAVAHGLGNAHQLISSIQSGEKQYHFIEVMTCPGGCVAGGGQPLEARPEKIAARLKGLYTIDGQESVRISHRNESVNRLYAEFLGQPLGHRSHELLHTRYEARELD
jgi:iron only hydrogenase large subunit-like protein